MINADLHMHTFYSDGTPSPRQNVLDSAILGNRLVAITDHDTTRGYLEAKDEADKLGVGILTGVEITTPDYHILGYDFDIGHKGLQSLLAYSRECQEEGVRLRIKKLSEVWDIPITFEKVKYFFPESRIGKYNIALTLARDRECRDHLGGIPINSIFNIYLGKHGLVGNATHKREAEDNEVIETIHAAGGIAVIAHPFLHVKKMEDLDTLVDSGLDGIEVQPNRGEANNIFKDYAERHNLLVTYGSDFHGASYDDQLLRRNGNFVKKFWK